MRWCRLLPSKCILDGGDRWREQNLKVWQSWVAKELVEQAEPAYTATDSEAVDSDPRINQHKGTPLNSSKTEEVTVCSTMHQPTQGDNTSFFGRKNPLFATIFPRKSTVREALRRNQCVARHGSLAGERGC